MVRRGSGDGFVIGLGTIVLIGLVILGLLALRLVTGSRVTGGAKLEQTAAVLLEAGRAKRVAASD